MHAPTVRPGRRVAPAPRSLLPLVAVLSGSPLLSERLQAASSAPPTTYVLSQSEFTASVDRVLLRYCNLSKIQPKDTVAEFEGSLPAAFQLPSDPTTASPLQRAFQSEALRAQALARMGFTSVDTLSDALGAGNVGATVTDLSAANGTQVAAAAPASGGAAPSGGTAQPSPNPNAGSPAKKLSDVAPTISTTATALNAAFPPASLLPAGFAPPAQALLADVRQVNPSPDAGESTTALVKVSDEVDGLIADLAAASLKPEAIAAAKTALQTAKTDLGTAVASNTPANAQKAIASTKAAALLVSQQAAAAAAIRDAQAALDAAHVAASSTPATGALFADTRLQLLKARKDLQVAGTSTPGPAATAADQVTTALSSLNAASLLTPVNHLFLWTGYQVANPYVFTPASGAPAADAAPVPAQASYNGTLKPSTTYSFVLELDYLNRLAWDPTRRATYSDHAVNSKATVLTPWDLSNWDIETRVFSSLNAASVPSGTGSGTTPTTTATAIEGSGDFGAEVAVAQNLFVTNSDLYNFQTVGLEERFGMVSNRAGYRNHQEFFFGPNYTIGYWPNISTNAEPVRLSVRYGLDYLDSVTFTDPDSQFSTAVKTANGTAEESLKPFASLQAELIYPLSTSTYLVIGGRVYTGHNRPTPWTSYLGYSIDVMALAQGLGLAPKPPTQPPASPPNP